MTFVPDNYEKVEDRIADFYRDHPQGRITTDVLHLDGDSVTFRASVFRELDPEPHPAATGHAHGLLIKPKAVEFIETVSIGRALANLNYAKTARMSAEEAEAFEDAKSQAQHPVGRATGPLAMHRANEPASAKQIDLGKRLLAQVDDGINIVTEHLGAYRPPEAWTKYEASGDRGASNGLIDKLIAAKEAQMGGKRPVRAKAPAEDDPWHMQEPPAEVPF